MCTTDTSGITGITCSTTGTTGTTVPVHWEAQDVPQAAEDFVHDFWVSVGSELGGDDGMVNIWNQQVGSDAALRLLVIIAD